jgi:hypothetical protein
MNYIKKLSAILIVADIALIFYSLSISSIWLLNSQIAFISSVFITLSSYLGYKKMISKKIASGDIPKEDRDDFEKLEDPHDLYSEDKEEDFQEVIKQERAKLTNFKTTAVNLGKSAGGAMSVFRLVAYGFLFLSFLYLNRHGLLEISAYLTGLAIVPISVVVSFIFYHHVE